jgi:hypothetical protein
VKFIIRTVKKRRDVVYGDDFIKCRRTIVMQTAKLKFMKMHEQIRAVFLYRLSFRTSRDLVLELYLKGTVLNLLATLNVKSRLSNISSWDILLTAGRSKIEYLLRKLGMNSIFERSQEMIIHSQFRSISFGEYLVKLIV